jgi:hypothetical protein
VRGAHFMSHTLWTAWLCWTTAFIVDVAATRGWHRTGLEPAASSVTAGPRPLA